MVVILDGRGHNPLAHIGRIARCCRYKRADDREAHREGPEETQTYGYAGLHIYGGGECAAREKRREKENATSVQRVRFGGT